MPQAIIPALVWLGTAIGSTFIVTYAAGIAAALILVGGMAYSAIKSKQARRDSRDQYNAAQVDRLASIRSAVAPRELVLGRVRKGGAVFYQASTGDYQKDMYLAIALAGHEIDAVESIYLNDVLVTLDGSGNVTDAPYSTSATYTGRVLAGGPYLPNLVVGSIQPSMTWGGGSDDGYWVPDGYETYQYAVSSSNVKITLHLGGAGQAADADLLAGFPAAWVAANTVEGCAYLVARLSYSETSFPSGIPNITAVIRGAKLYDSRSGQTVWSENPALMMRHVYQHAKFGKAAVTATEDARFIVAANACDTATTYTLDGVAQASRALYKGSLVLPFGAEPRSAFDDLAQAMGGSWAFAGGELYLKAGVYAAPVMSLGDADLAVIQRDGASETQKPISISVHRERAQKYNTVKTKIWDQARDYKQTDLTPLVGAALKARDGAELVQEVTMPAVGYAPQALHIAGVMMRDARDPLVVDLPFKLRAYPLELFDTVDLTLSRYGWASKQFMILGRVWTPDGSIQLTLKETTAAITQMDAGFSAQGFAANTNLPKPWLVEKVGALTASSGTAELQIQQDGTVISRLRISWPQSTDMAVTQNGQIEIQYRLSNSTGAWASLIVPGDETQVVTSEVADGAFYIIRARAKTTLAVSDWNVQIQHQVIGKTELPPVFDIFTVMAQPDGTRQYNFGYVAAAPVDWLGAEIRYVSGTTATPDWASMTRLQDSKTYYTSSPVELNAPLSGVYTFACKSLDTTGNESAYLVRSLTLPNRRLGDVFDEFYEHLEGWAGTLTGGHIQDGVLESNNTTTWATLPATWAAWTRWNWTPTSPFTYVSPVRDFGTIIVAQVNSTVLADGAVTQELATSNNGTTWSAWSSASAPISTRYLKLRLTVTATGGSPVPLVREWSYLLNALIKSEYINDVVISALTGSYRIGVGDVRIPLLGTYAVIKRTSIVIQDSSAGSWTFTRIDQALTYGPRYQFRLNGTLADPSFVDFFVEGY